MFHQSLRDYWRAVEQALQTGDATEHTHRPALVQLIQRLQPDALVINEPKRIACGAPDLAVQHALGGVAFTVGYIETKDVDASLDEAERSEQLLRYRTALPNLILTNYREFRWHVEGELRMKATLAPLLIRVHRVASTWGGRACDFPRFFPSPPAPLPRRGRGGTTRAAPALDSPLPRGGKGGEGEGKRVGARKLLPMSRFLAFGSERQAHFCNSLSFRAERGISSAQNG